MTLYRGMYPDFIEKKGWYTLQELGYLANALGFPRYLFIGAFKLEFEVLRETAVKEKALLDLLKSKALDAKLEGTYNRYDAKYNVKIITKSFALLRHRSLTFQELSDARVSFETYACDDGTGMPTEIETVQQAVKLVNRVISPLKLRHEMEKYLKHAEASDRFQMYEFFDLVPMCERVAQAEGRFHKTLHDSNKSAKPGSNSDVDFGPLLMTTEQQVLAFLDEEYRASLYHEAESCSPSADVDEEYFVHNELRETLVSTSRDEFNSIAPSIRNSATQLLLARSGHSPLIEGQSALFNKPLTPLLSRKHTYSQQKPLSFNFRTQSKNACPKFGTTLSTSGIRTDKRDAPHTSSIDYDALCNAAMLKAQGALAECVALMPPTPSSHKTNGAKAYSKRKARNTTKPCCIEPLVTDQDKAIHQGLINDLEWQTLQKKRLDFYQTKMSS